MSECEEEEYLEHIEQAESLARGKLRSELAAQVDKLLDEHKCDDRNWDGYDAWNSCLDDLKPKCRAILLGDSPEC